MSASNAEFGWQQWAEEEDYTEWAQNPVELEVKGARILHVYDAETVSHLPTYSIDETYTFKGKQETISHKSFDFEELAKHYDAIELTRAETERSVGIQYFDGWDCDSTLFFNGDHISIK